MRQRRDDRGNVGERGKGKGPRRRWSKEQTYVVVGTGARGKGGEKNRPVGPVASWAQAVQTKGRFLPLTSLFKVPSGFLAAK